VIRLGTNKSCLGVCRFKGFEFPGMWRSVMKWAVPKASNNYGVFLFMIDHENESNTTLWNDGSYVPKVRAWRPIRLESSAIPMREPKSPPYKYIYNRRCEQINSQIIWWYTRLAIEIITELRFYCSNKYWNSVRLVTAVAYNRQVFSDSGSGSGCCCYCCYCCCCCSIILIR
jgi:hypothetical protein